MKHLLSLRDLSADEIRNLLERALEMKAHPGRYSGALRGKALAMIFEKPSLRTRVSFDVGIHQLGGYSVNLTPVEINLGKRESVRDVARNLGRMVQGIMVRTFAHSIAEEMALHAGVPVINGLTDFSHPCQGLADYMTVLEVKGGLKGVKVAYVGDGNNVAHSLIYGGASLGVHFTIATPAGYEPNPQVVEWGRAKAKETGGRVEVLRDAAAAVRAADVVYTDVWASMGQESEAAERRRIFAPYRVDEALFGEAAPDAVFMHCLPAHRGEEVTDAVIDSPRSVVYQQAENRVHGQKAVMLELMG
ncbi:MAG: ornithine carbamoyltransferase [Acidobacteria bacterium]|nr:ornithine carbamoyltransferase [Acidobacteriota bacterium]